MRVIWWSTKLHFQKYIWSFLFCKNNSFLGGYICRYNFPVDSAKDLFLSRITTVLRTRYSRKKPFLSFSFSLENYSHNTRIWCWRWNRFLSLKILVLLFLILRTAAREIKKYFGSAKVTSWYFGSPVVTSLLMEWWNFSQFICPCRKWHLRLSLSSPKFFTSIIHQLQLALSKNKPFQPKSGSCTNLHTKSCRVIQLIQQLMTQTSQTFG